ncbi:MAG: hypothetical protein ABJE95_06905 [Byssovorax sp.]
MRALPLILTGLIAASVFTAACGSVDTAQQSTGATTAGVGGAGGADPTTGATTGDTTSSGDSASSSAASSSSTGGGPDIGQPSNVYPAKHAAAPKLVTYGGPILSAPKVYPVFFPGDKPAIVASVTDFYAKVGPSNYWKSAVSEYGVGALSSGAPIQLDAADKAPSSTTDDQIQTWLAGKLNNGDPAFPVPDANTIISLNYPVGTSISLQGSKSCQSFLGYHSNLTLDAAHGNMDVAYIVIPRCDMQSTGMNELDAITDTGTHELAEAATDPYPQTNGAYGQVDNNHIYWLFALGGGENGDMCAQNFDASYKDPEVGYLVQRTWSNKAAGASHNPCVPAAPGPYFNSAPLFTDTVTIGGGGQSIKVKGVQIPIGSTKVVEIDLFSDAKTSGPWQVEAHDLNEFMGGPSTLQFSFDAPGGQNGQKLHLSITPTQANQYKSEVFFVISTLGNVQNAWIGIVGN